MRCVNGNGTSGRHQRGFTLLLTMLVLLVGGASVYLAARDPGTAARASEPGDSARLLENARRALIAYALVGGTNNVPGALPCADTDMPGDGVTNALVCTNDGTVYSGWLPWKTLDLSREYARLWYIIDGDFRDETGEVEPLNVTVPGSLTLDAVSGYAALIVDPGDSLEGQIDRGSVSASIGDYLDGAENTNGDAVFVNCTAVADCNDRIVGISVDPLFAGVQRRAIGVIADQLQTFFDDNGYLPFAAAIGDGDGQCDDGVTVGLVATLQGNCGPYETLEESNFSSDPWVVDNGWLDQVVYVVDSECTPGWTSCPLATLALEDEFGLAVILAGPGSPLAGQDRGSPSSVADYLDSTENTDGDNVFDDARPAPDDNDVLTGIAS